MLIDYFPVLVASVVGVAIGLLPILAGRLLGPSRPYAAKIAPYECGFPALSEAQAAFDVRFYIVALLFILFDIELIFIFPWATVLRSLSGFAFLVMAFFVGLLLIGFLYEWKKGALEWE